MGDCQSLRAWEVCLFSAVFSLFLYKFFTSKFESGIFICMGFVYISDGFVKWIFLEYHDICHVIKKHLIVWEIWDKTRSFLCLGFPLGSCFFLPPLQYGAPKSCEYHVWVICWRKTLWKCNVSTTVISVSQNMTPFSHLRQM